ncbi:hypothetical protein FRC18_005607, partial [Serendipita sp. 400]
MSSGRRYPRRYSPLPPPPQAILCERCRRAFGTERALEQHLNASPRHHICPGCDFDYFTMDEMENCDCMGSEEYEDEHLPLDYDEGSAGTLSDGSGHELGWVHDEDDEDEDEDDYEEDEQLVANFRDQLNGWLFRRNHGPTSTSAPGSTSSRSHSHYWSSSEVSNHSNSYHSSFSGSTEAVDEEQLLRPYCQRCNRTFQTFHGLHLHCRSSRVHPWYCSECRTDFHRQQDLENHIDNNHDNPAESATTIPSISRPFDRAFAAARAAEAATRRSEVSRADLSTSTIRPSDLDFPSSSSPPPKATTTAQPQSNTTSASATAPTLAVTCPLCLDHAEELTSTLCGHVFCKECITAAVQQKQECP